VELEVGLGPWWKPWIAEYRDVEVGHRFTDVQVKGPFAKWSHTHAIDADGSGACFLEDHVTYRLPLGAVGRLFGGGLVRRKLNRLFQYRHRVLDGDLRAQARGVRPMRILVTGSSGLVGSSLIPRLKTRAHDVLRAVRGKAPGEGEVAWDAKEGFTDPRALEGIDAVVHLAGESIASGRWTEARKKRIRDSRVEGTRSIADAIARLETPRPALICASAVGIYGDRGADVVSETSPPGEDFLAGVCRDWEAACRPAADAGARVVNVRFGVILSPAGGALAKMLPPFKLGVGGRLGSGDQFMSWVTIDDVVSAIDFALATEDIQGPVNVVAPRPVTNREFTKTLGRVLRRPTVLPVPAFVLRTLLGEMADSLLLSGARVAPKSLEAAGFTFQHPTLEEGLRHVLGR
jgi:hypothetical protein